MFTLDKIGTAQSVQQPETTAAPEEFLKALESLNAADLKHPYLIEEFKGIRFTAGEFYIGSISEENKIDASKMAELAEKVGARLLPAVSKDWETIQIRIADTAALLDGKDRKLKLAPPQPAATGARKRVRPPKPEYDIDLTAMELGTALLAISAIGGYIYIKEGYTIPTFMGFSNDGAIDATEIDSILKDTRWASVMKRLYALLSKAKKNSPQPLGAGMVPGESLMIGNKKKP